MGRRDAGETDGHSNPMEDVMTIRTAGAEWSENLVRGSGHMRLGSGAFEGPYDFRSRTGDGKGANPKERLVAAGAGCFSMALALQPTNAGFAVKRVHPTAKVHFGERDSAWPIHRIDLDTEASVPDVAAVAFEEEARSAEKNCPVSPVWRRNRSACPSDSEVQRKRLSDSLLPTDSRVPPTRACLRKRRNCLSPSMPCLGRSPHA